MQNSVCVHACVRVCVCVCKFTHLSDTRAIYI